MPNKYHCMPRPRYSARRSDHIELRLVAELAALRAVVLRHHIFLGALVEVLAEGERLAVALAQPLDQWAEALLRALAQIEAIRVALVTCRIASGPRHKHDRQCDPNRHAKHQAKPESYS